MEVYEESMEGDNSRLVDQDQVMPMLMDLAVPEEQGVMLEELINVPIVISTRKEVLRDRPSNIQRKQEEGIQQSENKSRKKWKRIKGKEKAIIIREGIQKVCHATEGQKRQWSLRDEGEEESEGMESSK